MRKFLKLILFGLLLLILLPNNKNITNHNVFLNTSSKLSAETTISHNLSRDKNSKKFVEPVVQISIETPNGIIGTGTGFGIKYNKKTKKSYVITNHHVCEAALKLEEPYRIFYEDFSVPLSLIKQYETGSMKILNSDHSKDLCLLEASGYIKAASIAVNDYQVSQMEPVVIVGGPQRIFPVIIESYISNNIQRDFLPFYMQKGPQLLLISDIIIKGSSGSPVFNKRGEVIGVVSMTISSKNLAYGGIAISHEELLTFLREINFNQ